MCKNVSLPLVYNFIALKTLCAVLCLVAQSCPTLCDPLGYTVARQVQDTVQAPLIGSSVHGMLQTRILEWVALPSSRGDLTTQGSNLCL